MPKIKFVWPQPEKWTPFLVRAILPDVPLLLTSANAHQQIVLNAVLRGCNQGKHGMVIPFGYGISHSFQFSWDTISRHLNKNEPIEIKRRTRRILDTYKETNNAI